MLRQLPKQAKWEIARWLLDDLQETGNGLPEAGALAPSTEAKPGVLPDYAGRRRRIFGDKVLPNMVLAAREQERW